MTQICSVYNILQDPDPERLVKKKAHQYMQTLKYRINAVEFFLKCCCSNLQYDVMAIQDDFGPTRTDATLQALVGSMETARGCEKGTFL